MIKSETEADVESYGFKIHEEAKGFRYALLRERGRWLVISCKAVWIA